MTSTNRDGGPYSIQDIAEDHGVRTHVDRAGWLWLEEREAWSGADGATLVSAGWTPAPHGVDRLLAWLGLLARSIATTGGAPSAV